MWRYFNVPLEGHMRQVLYGLNTDFVFFRFDLDQLDTPDKYPDLFSVTLEVIVSPNEQPRTDSMYPWEKFDTQKLNPRILFSSKDELYQVLNDFGNISKLSHKNSLLYIEKYVCWR